MKTEQWDKLTPAHQAEIWPSLSEIERLEITTRDPNVARRIASATVDLLTATGGRDDREQVVKKIVVPPRSAKPNENCADDRPLSATICYVFAVLTLLGAIAIFVLGMMDGALKPAIYPALGCFAGAVVWWVLADIATGVHRLSRR